MGLTSTHQHFGTSLIKTQPFVRMLWANSLPLVTLARTSDQQARPFLHQHSIQIEWILQTPLKFDWKVLISYQVIVTWLPSRGGIIKSTVMWERHIFHTIQCTQSIYKHWSQCIPFTGANSRFENDCCCCLSKFRILHLYGGPYSKLNKMLMFRYGTLECIFWGDKTSLKSDFCIWQRSKCSGIGALLDRIVFQAKIRGPA